METYMQMTIDDYMTLKRSLGEDLLGVSKSFVRIGYKLRRIADSEQYKMDGYGSITEFAEKEYGLSKSTVSRFMAINRKYSVEGYSEELLPQFAGIDQSKLSDMLSLPDSDMQMIQPETQRSDIRELKQFNAMPAPEIEEDLSTFLREFFRQRHDELNEICASGSLSERDPEYLAEILCPSGNISFRKGKYFLMAYEIRVCIKEFGKDPMEYTWGQFAALVDRVLEMAGSRTWEANFGEPETEPEPAPEPAENKEKSIVAPAQLGGKNEQTAGEESTEEGTDEDVSDDRSEECDENSGSAPEDNGSDGGTAPADYESDPGSTAGDNGSDGENNGEHIERCEGVVDEPGSERSIEEVIGITTDLQQAIRTIEKWLMNHTHMEIEFYTNAAGAAHATIYKDGNEVWNN